MSKKHRITVNLSDEEFREFQYIAAKMDRSLAWVGKQAIGEYVARAKQAEEPDLFNLSQHAPQKGDL